MEQKAILPNSSALLNKAPGSIIHMLATPKIRWRTAFTYAIIILLLMLGLGFYLAMRGKLVCARDGTAVAAARPATGCGSNSARRMAIFKGCENGNLAGIPGNCVA
ncbi:MAG: hypothetical protein R2932_18245 [Caldilineaceae bacterium]